MKKIEKIIEQTQKLKEIEEEKELLQEIESILDQLEIIRDNLKGRYLTDRYLIDEKIFLYRDVHIDKEVVMDELIAANLVERYSKFWDKYPETFSSFGSSIALEEVNDYALRSLIAKGWKKIRVRIYEFEPSIDVEKLRENLVSKHKAFSLIEDKKNNTVYVFNYLTIGEMY